ncbi:protein kinase [Sorangium sp. So ce448]|uniref:protein kinase domain-containing protein n=1 Tax=Sorangium sp. So ce448 TaxID=3133314 RepID=UPI003F62AFE4
MRGGEVIAGRFEIEKLGGIGGMGEVYQARDRASGQPVAVKLLQQLDPRNVERLMREAALLAELEHPGICRYVAHGMTAQGVPYLAMEWLEGEDLCARLERRGLSVDETVTLVTRAAEALAVVHARRIVHRDLKPSNLFLVERDVARVKLLDFGIARFSDESRMTQSGMILGTPAYIAPEQARSRAAVDARADVFALGCVLFECLTGVQAFRGDSFMSILLKIVLEDVQRASELRADVPPSLDVLCTRMLAKDPAERPRDGAAVAAALNAVGLGATLPIAEVSTPVASVRASPSSSSPSLTHKERRVTCVLLMAPEPPMAGGAGRSDAETEIASAAEEMTREVAALGVQLDLLMDSSILMTFTGTGLATDQAVRAARCALSLRKHAGGRRLALATGTAELSGRLPASELVDRATRTLAQSAPSAGAAHAAGQARPIAIDEVTAGLLDARFDVFETETGLWLQGEQALAKGARTLLGRPTACVGRDWVIAAIEALRTQSIEESRARAVLVTGPAGMGKSRIAYELLLRVRQRDPPFALWVGRGDPLRTGAALGLLGQALRQACGGIQDGEPLEERREKLRAHVNKHFDGADARRVSEFLGELLNTPFPDEDSIQLHAARRDVRLLGDQMQRAWVDFLEAVSGERPLLLVMEDLHWSDAPTVQYLDEALRRVRDRPWMLLALARPEVHEVFPRLWAERQLQEIRLDPLTSRASARLVRQVLGDQVSEATLERIVTQAEGNAFYLEELIRATSEGNKKNTPETVLAMVRSRLEGLDDMARRLLRAGSVFGDVFWRGAIDALLGGMDDGSIDAHLARLEGLEWIITRSASRFQGEREIAFRHALVREAAYGMLTEEDRALGHRLAGAWLERAAEPSAAVIAEHFDRAGERARAAELYRTAAAQAFAANDFAAVLRWAERALSLGVSGAAREELLLLRTEARRWRGDIAEFGRCAQVALRVLPRGTAPWYVALAEAGRAARHLGQREDLLLLDTMLADAWRPDGQATAPAVTTAASIALDLLLAGLHERAEAIDARIESVAERFRDDPSVSGPIYRQRGMRELFAGHLEESCAFAARALRCYEEVGDLRRACVERCNLGFRESLLGAYAEARTRLRAAVAEAEQMGLDYVLGFTLHDLGRVLGRTGALEEACVVEAKAAALCAAQGSRRGEGWSRTYLAGILRSAGRLDEAEGEARRAVALLETAQQAQVAARATLASVLLARGRSAEALAESHAAMALLATVTKVEEGEALARLVHAEALYAAGERGAARAAIADARDRLLAVAVQIADPRTRDGFLHNVEENARTLELSEAWLDDGSGGRPAE